MSYIQINLGGKPRGLKFNQEGIEIFFRRINWDERTAASEVYAAFYGGLCANIRVKGSDEVISYEDCCDWVDELTEPEKEEVMKVMGETVKYKEALDKIKDRIRLLADAVTDDAKTKKKAVMKT